MSWARLWDDLPTRISLIGAAFYLLVIIYFCCYAALVNRREFEALMQWGREQREKNEAQDKAA